MIGVHFLWLLARAVARIFAPLMIAGVVALLPLAAFAAQITVDGTTCTLPDAMTAANTDAVAGGCAAGSGADTLLLTAPIYSLATGPYNHDGLTATPSVTSKIVISGGVDGAIVERSGAAKYRLFHVGDAGDLTLQRVTVRHGDIIGDGGAIYNRGTLTLLDSDMISNAAVQDDSADVYTGNGGAIYNRGTLTLVDSDMLSNAASCTACWFAASLGGGIYNGDTGALTLLNSDVIKNVAKNGGGLYNSGTVTLSNSDFISNTALSTIDPYTGQGGGLFNNNTASPLTSNNSDFIANRAFDGGGIYNISLNPLTLNNSEFIANNGSGLYSYSDGAMIILSNTLFISNTAGLGGGLRNSGMANLTNTLFMANDASIAGGGVYNARGRALLTLTNTQFISNTAGFGGGLYNEGTANITHTLFVDNKAGEGGGIDNVGSTAILSDSVFISNTAAQGGGLYNVGSTAILSDSVFISNTADSGGGLYNDYFSTATLIDSGFISNTADSGGGLYNDSSTATLTNSNFAANSATYGGGIYNNDHRFNEGGHIDGLLTLTNTEIRANVASAGGGGLYQVDGQTTIVSSRLLDNVVGDTGGVVQQTGGATSISQSCIVNNTDTSVNYVGGDPIDADNNWWGAPDGPSGAGSGAGDSVSSNVTYAPFLTTDEVCAVPGLAIFKDANTTQAYVGDTITYTYRIINTGNITLTTISATDNQLGAVAALAGALVPNATRSATLTYVVQESDLPGPLANTVIVTGTDSFGTVVTDSDNASVITLPAEEVPAPAVAITKQVNTAQARVGDTITYTYRITNTGNVTLTTVTAIDNKLGEVAALAGQLLPNATSSATFTYVIQAIDLPGPLTNTVTVTGTDSFGTVVTDSASASVITLPADEVAVPAVTISKQVNTTQARVGDTITYTYRITNTGNVTLTAVSVEDNVLGTVAALAGQLLPNATRSATFTYVVQAIDLPGPLTNTVTVTGTDSFGTVVTDSASASVNLLPQEKELSRIYLPQAER